MHRALTFILTILLAPWALGQDPFGDEPLFQKETTATIVPESTVVEPGDFFRVAFTLDLQPHYHAFYKNGGIVGDPPSVDWKLPEGFTAGELMFPRPSVISSESAEATTILYGYEETATFLVKIFASADLEEGKELTIEGVFKWQECNEICIQGDKDFSFKIKTSDETDFPEAVEDLFLEASDRLPQGGSAWGIGATEKENTITLEVAYPEAMTITEPVYFFSDDKQIDSQAPQKVNLTSGKIVLTLARNEGNKELFIDPGEVAESLTG
ncbi:MAG: DsbC/DsbD-like thiol-disulfide interchange protein, partial [Akkermansiaceae bacterium]